MNSKIDNIVAVAIETTGFNKDDLNKASGHQILSFGMVSANTVDYKAIKSTYYEVKWNGTSLWNTNLEPMHGFTREYLNNNGIDEETAAAVMADFFIETFENKPVVLLGHNVSTFSYWFIKDLLHKYNMNLTLSSRIMDTFTLGKLLFNFDDSHKIFNVLQRNSKLNALEKADAYLQFMRIVKSQWENGLK